MKKNMGSADKLIRFSVAGVILLMYFNQMISGVVAIILMMLAAIFILTSFVSFCPLYFPFGISTIEKRKN